MPQNPGPLINSIRTEYEVSTQEGEKRVWTMNCWTPHPGAKGVLLNKAQDQILGVCGTALILAYAGGCGSEGLYLMNIP